MCVCVGVVKYAQDLPFKPFPNRRIIQPIGLKLHLHRFHHHPFLKLFHLPKYKLIYGQF